ncbi:MAG: SIMPL domain-containing protein [Gammaproteobacteria bacterium]|nr:SIMPL domain-containing protein [Gammaproteobacteria bacterium]
MKQILLALVLALLTVSACAHENEPRMATIDSINVSGIGEIEAEPDQAVLSVSVTAQKALLAAAKSEADERYQSVLNVIKNAGIADKYVKGTQLSAQPQYDYRDGKRVYRGERVSRSLAITVNDLEQISPLIQALVEQGVSTIDGVQSGFQDRAGLEQQALGAAADDAKRKAEFLAQRLGRSLGQAFLINEASAAQSPVYHREVAMKSSAMAADAAPPEMFGLQKVRAQISVSFSLL